MSVATACDRRFHPAAHTSGTRAAHDVWWIVLHDEEASDAASSAAWFQNPSSGGSAHLCVDDTTCFRCLDNDVIPWGAASSFGANTHGIHIEQAGFARWSLVLWRRHVDTLNRAAYKTAMHCKAFGVPARFVTAADLPAMHGITTHREVSAASRRLDPANASVFSHSDPGRLWPRRLFMARVREHFAGL